MEEIDNDNEDTWRDITADLEGLGVDPASVPSHQEYIKRWLDEVVFGESAEGVESQDQFDGLDDDGGLGNQAPTPLAGTTDTISEVTLNGRHDDWGAFDELSRRCPSASSHRSKDSNWRPLNGSNPDYVQNLLSRLLNLQYSGDDDPNTKLVPIKRVYHQADWNDGGYLYRTDVERHCKLAISKTDFSCEDQELIDIITSGDKNHDGRIDCSEFVRIIQTLIDSATKAKEREFQQLVVESNLQGAIVAQHERKLLWSARPDLSIIPWGWTSSHTPSEGFQYTSPLGVMSRSDPVVPADSFTGLAFNAATVCMPRISQAQEKWGKHTAKMSKHLSNEYQMSLERVLEAASKFVILEGSHGPTSFSDLDTMVAMADLVMVNGAPEFEGCPIATLGSLQQECYNMLNATEGFVFELKDSELKQLIRSSEPLVNQVIKQDDCSDTPPSIREWRRLQMPARALMIENESSRWDKIQGTVSDCRAWYRSHPELESRVHASLHNLDLISCRIAGADKKEMAARNAEAAMGKPLPAERDILLVTSIAADGLPKPDLFSKSSYT